MVTVPQNSLLTGHVASGQRWPLLRLQVPVLGEKPQVPFLAKPSSPVSHLKLSLSTEKLLRESKGSSFSWPEGPPSVQAPT